MVGHIQLERNYYWAWNPGPPRSHLELSWDRPIGPFPVIKRYVGSPCFEISANERGETTTLLAYMPLSYPEVKGSGLTGTKQHPCESISQCMNGSTMKKFGLGRAVHSPLAQRRSPSTSAATWQAQQPCFSNWVPYFHEIQYYNVHTSTYNTHYPASWQGIPQKLEAPLHRVGLHLREWWKEAAETHFLALALKCVAQSFVVCL